VSRAPRLLAAVLTLSLAACSGDSGPNAAADPTPATWPQPVAGKLTPQMCDLLTPADFEAAGLLVLEWKSKESRPDIGPNAVTCHALGDTWLTLSLQPDPASAELYYTYSLDQHRRDGSKTVQENGVPGAEASWFDVSEAGDPVRQALLRARRGALLVELRLGFLTDKENYDPRKAAATLASLVLERIPEVGAVATGKPHEIVLTVTGKGLDSAMVINTGPLDAKPAQEASARLPWTRKIQAPWFGTRPQTVTLSAMNTSVLAKPVLLTCTITVDGKQVAQQSSASSVYCNGNFRDNP
jgi:hypothetical protein